MSWKSLVCAGLLCALVTPVSAQPVLSIDLVRHTAGPNIGLAQLDSNGDWQWRVKIEGDGTGAIEAALAFIASGGTNPLVSAVMDNSGHWDHQVPADDPASFGNFSWLPNDINGRAEGIDVSTANNELQASFGSITFNPQTNSNYLLIKTNGPNTANSLSTTLTWGGAYNLDGNNAPIPGNQGLIAQGGTNYVGYAGSSTKTVLGGDTNLSGDVDIFDFLTLQSNFNQPGVKIWSQGDYNGTGNVDIFDFLILQGSFNTAPIPAPGSGSAVVPEPASALLMLMAGAMLLVARVRRK